MNGPLTVVGDFFLAALLSAQMFSRSLFNLVYNLSIYRPTKGQFLHAGLRKLFIGYVKMQNCRCWYGKQPEAFKVWGNGLVSSLDCAFSNTSQFIR